jgi:hypothetical protein
MDDLQSVNFNALSLPTESASYHNALNNIVKELHTLVSLKAESDYQRLFFLDMEEESGIFDDSVAFGTADLYQTLSTPDFKLHYPEPFIASPSFVHEEL